MRALASGLPAQADQNCKKADIAIWMSDQARTAEVFGGTPLVPLSATSDHSDSVVHFIVFGQREFLVDVIENRITYIET